MVSPTFTFKTRLTSTTATCVCCARLFLSTYIETSFLLEIVYHWMIKRTEKSCLKMVQGQQEVLTGDPEGLTWEEFEKEVMRWAQPIYGTSYAIGLWCNQLPGISLLDLKEEEEFNTLRLLLMRMNHTLRCCTAGNGFGRRGGRKTTDETNVRSCTTT